MRHTPTAQLLIVGASARAAADSARRGGMSVWAVDRFGDSDLARHGQTLRLSDFPDGLATAFGELPPAPWVYTGPLENRPRLIKQLAATRPLYGNQADVVRRVRNPYRLARSLQNAGLACPALAEVDGPPTRGKWLRKPVRSGGGVGVADWPPAGADGTSPRGNRRWLLQEFIPGPAMAAVYVAADGNARMLGVTRQLAGCNWCGATNFQYCGSLGPVTLAGAAHQQLEQAGKLLATTFQLRGLFGVDFVLHCGRPWILEVNPRFTASIEILERAGGMSCMALHADACLLGSLPDSRLAATGTRHGKCILYATRDLIFCQRHLRRLASEDLADIPQPGSLIAAGQPILTVFATANSVEELDVELQRRAHLVRTLIDEAAN